MNIDLKEMTQLAAAFRDLFKGYHISRSEPECYAQLSSMQDQYRALFRALGFELVCDPRGFYYFVPEQVAPQVNKTAQRLALFTFILVEHLADQGRDPLSVLDGGSIGRDELPALLEASGRLELVDGEPQAPVSEAGPQAQRDAKGRIKPGEPARFRLPGVAGEQIGRASCRERV